MLRDEDFAHWYVEGKGRPSVPPSAVAGAFLMSLREGQSYREAEQRMRFDLRWERALGLGLEESGCDHTSICVFRARPWPTVRREREVAADMAYAGAGLRAEALENGTTLVGHQSCRVAGRRAPD